MDIKAICDAYSARDDAALLKALEEFRRQLSDDVYTVGPAATAMLLREAHLLGILNKTAAEAEDKPGGSLALVVGHLSAYIHYVELIADRERVDSAVAQLSNFRDQGEQASLIRMAILKSSYGQCGERPKEIIKGVARWAKAGEGSVKVHLQELLEMELIEKIQVRETLKSPRRGVMHYHISYLGEAVLHRLMHPYALPLWCVDEAAFDPEMRAAMRDEIKRAWPSDER